MTRHNALISNWYNGFDFSLKRMSGLSHSDLLGQLSEISGARVSSVADAYSRIFSDIPVLNTSTLEAPKPLDQSGRGKPFLRALYELQDYVRANFTADEILGFYVHGSLSTMDYVENYSDFDTLVILRKAVVDDPVRAADLKRRLTRSNTFLFLLDPLQHHHHFTLTEYDLEHYLEPIFPLVLFEYASELSQLGNKLAVYTHEAGQALLEPLAACRRSFEQQWPSMRRLRAYDVKNAVSNILLLPALYVQARTGKYFYKRDTFEKARSDFEPALWSIVERASAVRRQCQYRSAYSYGMRKRIGMHMHYKVLHQLHRNLDNDNSREMLKVLGPDFLSEAAALAQKMEQLAFDAR